MGKPVVYIDGQSGTTGLQIQERLSAREDIELIRIADEVHRDPVERKKIMNQADLVFFCLPDAAAVEAAGMIENPKTRVIDASTAHRVNPEWAYGIPELSPVFRERIGKAARVANPGCHASGFVTSVYPLVQKDIIPTDAPLTVFSLTGYSGGGKKMIAEYEAPEVPAGYGAPRIYGLTLHHKHLPEMQIICGLEKAPVFVPVVDDYYKGMAVTVMLQNSMLGRGITAEKIHETLADWYEGSAMIKVHPFGYEGMISAETLAGKDTLELIVNGHEDQTIVTALFDNLGKGASGAAVQNMNIMLGIPETTGLNV